MVNKVNQITWEKALRNLSWASAERAYSNVRRTRAGRLYPTPYRAGGFSVASICLTTRRNLSTAWARCCWFAKMGTTAEKSSLPSNDD